MKKGHHSETAPLVSVIIPAFNAAPWISEAILSVWNQTDSDWELIVVNDGSTDETHSVLRALQETQPFRLIQQQTSGPSVARNTGAKTARGEWLLFLDADDRLHPRFLAETLSVGKNRPALGVVCTEARLFGERKGTLEGPTPTLLSLLERNTVTVTSLLRRSAFLSVGGFDERMTFGYEDWDLWLRVAQRGWNFLRVPQLLFEYRIRHGSHNDGEKDPLLAHCRRLSFLHRKHRKLYEADFPKRPREISRVAYQSLKSRLRLRHRLTKRCSPETLWSLAELAGEWQAPALLPPSS